MELTTENYEEIEKLASLNYTVRQIAMYLNVSLSELQKEFEDKESKFRYHYQRGKLISQAKIDMKINESAQGGNMTAMQQFEKIRNARHFENMRNQMFDGDI